MISLSLRSCSRELSCKEEAASPRNRPLPDSTVKIQATALMSPSRKSRKIKQAEARKARSSCKLRLKRLSKRRPNALRQNLEKQL